MNRDDIRTIGQPYARGMTRDEEKLTLWQTCANLCKSIAVAYEKAGTEFREQQRSYWLKSAGFEEKILAFIERKEMKQASK